MDKRTLALLAVALAAPAMAQAQDDFRHGRVRTVEAGVALQRATEAGAEQATWNLPFLPGDRVWSDETGRAEFQFPDGSTVRIDSRTKLDYVDHEEGRQRDRIVLRVWSGGLYVHFRDNRRSADFELETPGGVVSPRGQAVLRIDIDSGETRLSVYQGQADFEGERRLRLRAGERLYARRGESDEPERFDRGALDDFARWDADLEERLYRAEQRYDYLPEEVAPYASELEAHGGWYYEADIGNVWRPYVAHGWRPYFDGRWVWTPYGWTWVPHEPWGWAPSHYGRWGHSVSLGWYWIPGRHWGPAWVSWAVGSDVVGWCPLGYRDRPVTVFNRGPRGHAVPRGSLGSIDMTAPWTYVRRSDITAHDLARRRVEADAALVRGVRVLDTSGVQLTRDLQQVQGQRAVPRIGRRKPTIGDTVPELRTDPETTIPLPVARQRRPPEEDREPTGPAEMVVPRRRPRDSQAPSRRGAPESEVAARPVEDAHSAPRRAEPVAPDPVSQPDVVAQPRWRTTRERPQSEPAVAAPRDGQTPREGSRPSGDSERAAPRFRREEPRPEPERPRREEPRAEPERFRREEPRSEPERPRRQEQLEPERERRVREPEREHRTPEADPGREVLRPLFRPLSQPRQAPEGERSGEAVRRPRGAEGDAGHQRPRPEAVAPREAQPPQQPAPEREEGAARRKREKP